MMNNASQQSYNNSTPTLPLSQSNPQLQQLHHQQQQQQQYVFHQQNQQQQSIFQQPQSQQQQQARMMLIDPRGYHSSNPPPTPPQQQQQIPSLLQQSRNFLSGQQQQQQHPHSPLQQHQHHTLHQQRSNQWGKQPCVVCNETFTSDLLSLMPCGHRVCNQCFNSASQSNGFVAIDKCPICSLISTTTNLTSLLSNNNIRDAFNSQTVSPIGFNPSTPPSNPQSANSKIALDNTFSIWEPLPLSGGSGNSRTQSFSSSSVYPTKQQQQPQGAIMPQPPPSSSQQQQHQGTSSSQVSSSSGGSFHGFSNRSRQSIGSNRSSIHQLPLTPSNSKSMQFQFQFKEKENNNEFLQRNSKCTNCDEKATVVGYCLNCKEVLCSECVMAHARVKITKEHKIQVIDESFNPFQQQQLQTTVSSAPPSRLPPPQQHIDSMKTDSESPNSYSGGNNSFSSSIISCPEHDLFFITLCTTCGGIHLCLRCLPNHTGHNLRILPVYEPQTSLRRLINESKNIQRSFEDSKEGIKRMIERIEASVQSVVGEMRSIIHLHISALEERKRDLLQRVDSIHQTKILSLNQQNEKICDKMNSLDSLIKYGEQLCAHETSAPSSLSGSSPGEEDPRYLECYEKLIKLHSESFIPLIPTANDSIRLKSIDPTLLQSLKSLGQVESGLCPKATQLLGTRFKRAITGRPCVINIQMKDVCGDPIGKQSREQGGEFVATLYGPLSGGNATLQHADIIDRDNGVCSLMFAPKRVGIYRLNVTYCQVSITGCPTEINVCSGRDYKDAQTTGQKFSFGKEGSADGEFQRPWGICCDLKGRILVADRSNHRIQIFDGRGNFLTKFGHRGNRQGELNRPAGICVNPSNDIIIADKDNHRIQIYFDNGGFSHGFGSRGCSPGLFNYPWGVATNNSYEIAVTDTRNHRVQIFTSTGQMLKICTIDSEIKRSPSSPRGICFLPDNELIVSDFNTHRLAVLNAHGEPRFFGLEGTAPGFFHRPQGIAVDPDGLVLVCDSRSNRVQVLNIYDLTVVAVLGNDTKHQRPDLLSNDKFLDTTLFRQTTLSSLTSNDTSSSQVVTTPNANLLEHPMDVCVSPDGLVYVVDFGNNCIRVY
jgi:tripartite motif-containing protein 71